MAMKTSSKLLTLLRPLTPSELLNTIRGNPGMTAEYYANRYFGKDKVMEINHFLWGNLKRYGKIYHERNESDAPPKWFPVFGMARIHRVYQHNSENEDLSVLRSLKDIHLEESAQSDSYTCDDESFEDITNEDGVNETNLKVEMTIMQEVQKKPGEDIQFYIQRLPVDMQRRAPLAFKRLRESGMIKREFTTAGGFVWH
ncbi:unnamed protein product [Phytomonas sp. Hart1]|nr:unnamed protein product [Phytomonas sp. Hart1]|eukprot:CCW70078.1 unnamed protein product [Phytomonas sp. isolate Hart1]